MPEMLHTQGVPVELSDAEAIERTHAHLETLYTNVCLDDTRRVVRTNDEAFVQVKFSYDEEKPRPEVRRAKRPRVGQLVYVVGNAAIGEHRPTQDYAVGMVTGIGEELEEDGRYAWGVDLVFWPAGQMARSEVEVLLFAHEDDARDFVEGRERTAAYLL